MEKLTFQQIVDLLDENYNLNDFKYLHDENNGDLGDVKQVYHYGGSDKGTHYETVNHFVDHDVYIKLEGYYTSDSGVEYDGYYYEEVKPKEKLVIVYE